MSSRRVRPVIRPGSGSSLRRSEVTGEQPAGSGALAGAGASSGSVPGGAEGSVPGAGASSGSAPGGAARSVPGPGASSGSAPGGAAGSVPGAPGSTQGARSGSAPGAASDSAPGATSGSAAGAPPGEGSESPNGDERPPETGPIDTAIEVVRVEAPPSGEQLAVAAPSESRPWAVIIGVVAVVLGLFAVVAWFQPGANVENRAYVDNAATDEVKAAASNALTTISTYAWDKMDEWPDRAKSVLTQDMQEQFDKTVDVTKSAAVQSKTTTQAKVDDVGVSLLDATHAEVLAFLTVSVENDGVAMGSSSGPELIHMQKVDGDWLLSEVVLQ